MLHLHADPIRDTRFAGGRHPFVDWNRTVTHAVANYKKHEALKITFRVSRFPARTLGHWLRNSRVFALEHFRAPQIVQMNHPNDPSDFIGNHQSGDLFPLQQVKCFDSQFLPSHRDRIGGHTFLSSLF